MNREERIEKLEELKCYLEDQEIAISDTYSLLRFNMIDDLIIGETWLNQLLNMQGQTASMIENLENFIGEQNE